MRTPVRDNTFRHAIGATALGLFFIVPGALGCRLHKSDFSVVSCAPWSDTVLWPEVGFGVAVLMVAAYLWRRAILSTRGAEPTSGLSARASST